jgi:Uma2 family endonuclease
MPVSEETFRRVALEDPEGHWELDHGCLRRKPGMSFPHNFAMTYLGGQLISQLDPEVFQVRINSGHVNRTDRSFFIPDVFVYPVAVLGPESERDDVLEVYDEPLPFVVEVWSRSTGDYDVDKKIPEYMRRGDLEIWRLDASSQTLIAWRRQPDGTYERAVIGGGVVEPVSLPGVRINLDALFRRPPVDSATD